MHEPGIDGLLAPLIITCAALILAWGAVLLFTARYMQSDLPVRPALRPLLLLLMALAGWGVVENGYLVILFGFFSDGMRGVGAQLLAARLMHLLVALAALYILFRIWRPAWDSALADAQERELERVDLQRKLKNAMNLEAYLNNILTLGATFSQLLINARTLEALLNDCCDQFLRYDNYKAAWIGLLDRNGVLVERAQADRCDPAYLSAVGGVEVSADEWAQGPMARCLAERKLVVIGNARHDRDFKPWHDAARASAIQSVAAFPLRTAADAEPVGCLVLYTGRGEGFSNRELKALQGVADNIGRAVEMRQEAERRAQAEAGRERCAMLDYLTMLPNRYALHDMLDKRISEAQRFRQMIALLYLDLDNFREINDTHGLDAGDQLLQGVAERLSTQLREFDVLARFGGDAFVLMIPALMHQDEAGLVAGRVMAQFDEPFEAGGRVLRITASMGISLYPGDAPNGAELLRCAESAMEEVKQTGRGHSQFFSQAMNEMMRRHQEISARLHSSLEQGDFRLLYQPQYDLAGGEVISCEVLIRWYVPEEGLLLPALFLSVAEKSELICLIGDWVLETVCRRQVEWKQLGLPPLRMDINYSPRQFHHQDFCRGLVQALERHHLSPGDLGIELSEQLFHQADEKILQCLGGLRESGIRIALDDYGTGNTSLTGLQRIPVDGIKIDERFIRRIGDDVNARMTVQAMIAMGRSLGLEISAEGIETDEQLEGLRQLGCGIGQGYRLGRPMEWEQLVQLVQSRKDINKLHPIA